MNLSEPFIRRPVATTLIAAAVLLVGVAAFFILPVSALPSVDFPTVQVSAALPGASPETMASNVATPLERQFSLIPGIIQMTSISSLGSTSVTIQFQLGQSLTSEFQQVQAAINAASAQLPTNLPAQPSIRQVNPADAPIMILSQSSDTLPIDQVDNYADVIFSPAALHHKWGWSRQYRRRTEARGAHPARPAENRRAGAADRRRAHQDHRLHHQCRQRLYQR